MENKKYTAVCTRKNGLYPYSVDTFTKRITLQDNESLGDAVKREGIEDCLTHVFLGHPKFAGEKFDKINIYTFYMKRDHSDNRWGILVIAAHNWTEAESLICDIERKEYKRGLEFKIDKNTEPDILERYDVYEVEDGLK